MNSERVEIRVNTTAVVTAQQGLLAALAGVTYVSMLVGRMSDSGLDPYSELRTLRQALDGQGPRAQIIAGSIGTGLVFSHSWPGRTLLPFLRLCWSRCWSRPVHDCFRAHVHGRCAAAPGGIP